MKRVLITGANSYVGTNVEKWLAKYPDKYHVDTISVKGDAWREQDFSEFDVLFHVAGIVHKKEKPRMRKLYFGVNRDLTLAIASKAKDAGVSQFIFMSTMAVYGEDGEIGQDLVITKNTATNPKSFYALSKLEAEQALNRLKSDTFKVAILRPPMVYGPNCPGNYARLEKLASKITVFPMVESKRSVVHIDRLCQCIQECIDNQADGLYFPQDDEYINTSMLVKELAERNGNSIHLSKTLGLVVKLLGRRSRVTKKVFGSLVYEKHI